MANIEMRNGQQLKCVLTFDNNKTYECVTSNSNDHVLQTARINENEGITSGNPLGIMSSNTANISILDASGDLVLTNASSPYAGYMRNGVKMVFTLINIDGTTEPFGVYYTDDWDTRRANGGYDTTNLNGKDFLDYIGNMEIPELDAFSSVEISSLLVAIFEGLGLTSDEYYIDPTLNLRLTFSVTKGAKVRDTLNSIANALIARIVIDRSGVICVKPAFPEIPEELDTLNSQFVLDTTIAHNSDSQYNRVRLDYVAVGIRESETLATLDNYTVIPGENTIDSVAIPSNTQGIDGVYLTYDVTSENFENMIDSIDYTGYQGGISIVFNSLASENFTADIVVAGRTSGATKQSIYADVNTANPIKVANLLILTSEYIQSKAIAEQYINAVAEYLRKISATIKFNSLFSPLIKTGTYVNIENTIETLTGTYYLSNISFHFGESYSVNVTAIKMN